MQFHGIRVVMKGKPIGIYIFGSFDLQPLPTSSLNLITTRTQSYKVHFGLKWGFFVYLLNSKWAIFVQLDSSHSKWYQNQSPTPMWGLFDPVRSVCLFGLTILWNTIRILCHWRYLWYSISDSKENFWHYICINSF